ncbi:hypothetical protein X731_27315 [Mesorhizobium sp. L2C054A000]|nr:hypothetical protein X731_27315 [Mesorhizobium sp. L2C054A000]
MSKTAARLLLPQFRTENRFTLFLELLVSQLQHLHAKGGLVAAFFSFGPGNKPGNKIWPKSRLLLRAEGVVPVPL